MIKQQKDNIAKYLFFIALAILISVDYISATSILIPFSGRLFQIVVLLLGIKILLTKFTKWEWCVLSVGAIISILSFYYIRSYFCCILFLLLFASKDMNSRLIMKVYLFLVTGITVFVGGLAALGIVGNTALSINYRGDGVETRYCMGYTHPNTYHIILIQLMMALVWIYWEKVKLYHLIILFATNLVLFHFTDSRTNLILGSVYVLCVAVAKVFPLITEMTAVYSMMWLELAISLFISATAVIWGVSLAPLNLLNEIWTGRILFANMCAENTVLSFFSSTKDQIAIDMGFVSTTYNYGMVVMIMVILLMASIIYRIMHKKDFVMMMEVIVCIVFYLGEKFSSGDYITRNLIFVLMLGWGAYESDKQKK